MNDAGQLGPYRLLRPLGSGGMAETYLAAHVDAPGVHVCLKRIRTQLAEDPGFVRQFEAEARLTAALRDEAIAGVLDVGHAEGGHFLVLAWVDGLDLRALLEHGGPLPPGLVLLIGGRLARALSAAHAADIVHRDVSPSNVLLGRDGSVKLADFGIARALGDPRHTRTGIVKGKYPYMAPEYVATGRFEARCDLFSLGVLLFECLTGTRPYDGADELETVRNAATGNHRMLTASAPATPEVLVQVIDALIAPDAHARPRSARAAAELLGAVPGAAGPADLAKRVAAACPLAPPQQVTCAGSEPDTAATQPGLAAAVGTATTAQARPARAPVITLAVALFVAAFTAAYWWLAG